VSFATEFGPVARKGKQKTRPTALKKSGRAVGSGFPTNAAASVVTDLTGFIASSTPRSANPQVKESRTMDIKDIKSAKMQLQDQISDLLVKFSEDTGLSVDAVNIDNVITMGAASIRYLVSIEVKL
jgi:hypothetical protein